MHHIDKSVAGRCAAHGGPGPCGPGHADRESGVKQLQNTIDGMQDGLKTLLGYDTECALKESDEYDGGECAEALNHADGLLKAKP